MSITEPQRLALHTAARSVLGDEEGDTLMAALPPSNTDVATRQDVEHLAEMTRGELARVETGLRGEIARVETGLRGEIARVETGLRGDIARVETGLRGEIARVETGLRGEIKEVAGRLKPLEDRVGARITKACDDLRDELTRRIHRSELRTIAAVALAFIADRALG